MMNRLTAVLLAASITACAWQEPGTLKTEAAIFSPTPEREAFTNASAMEAYGNLGLVKGAPAPLPETRSSSIADPQHVFSEAIDYGAKTGSYALLIWWDGSLVLEHYYAGYDASIRAEPASMHKSLLGLVTARAMDEGHIESPDTPIGRYIPEWRDDQRGKITVGQLLTMSSGLTPLSQEGGDDAPARKFMNGNLDARATILGMLLEDDVVPHFHYMNTVSQLLLLVVENAVGKPYGDYLSESLWQPIGAGDAYVYYFEEAGFPRGYASFLARPLDWLRLGLLVKDDGRFGERQVIDGSLVQTFKAPSAHNRNYGWQVWRGETWDEQRFYNAEKTGFSVLQSEPYLVDDLVFFDGFGGQRVIASASEDLVIVRVGDTSVIWDDAQLPNSVLRALHTLPSE